MKFIFKDFETYYDKDYSLRKMTVPEYVLDPRFELIGCAIAEDNNAPFWLEGPDYLRYVQAQKMDEVVFVSHNALFDMFITSHVPRVTPKLYIDTMSMARANVFAFTGRVSLEAVAKHLGIGVKGNTIHNVAGMRAADIKAAGLWDAYVEYALNDVTLCRKIYGKLRAKFPPQEIVINDMVIRCATNPKFEIDQNVLAEHLHEVQVEKQALLDRCGIEVKDLMSNEKFAEVLRTLGIEPPMKVSRVTGKEAYAFAKTDEAMIELEEHDDPVVQAVVAARLGHKSTLEETRTEKLIRIAQLPWPQGRPVMPIPLRYSGAHTHRLSGDWKINMQNLPRGSKLRKALRAPEGYKVVTVDSSQVEARIVAWLARCMKLVDLFDQGKDVYSTFASSVYGYPVNKKEHPSQRFVGKQAVLGLGFGMGAARFEKQLKSDSHKQGLSVEIDQPMAERVVRIYRTEYPEIPMLWKWFNQRMEGLATGENAGEMIGPVTFEKQALLLPSGLRLFYHDLSFEVDAAGRGQWRSTYGNKRKKLFGGLMTENVVQALARIATFEAAVRIRRRLAVFDIELALQVHDELVYIVPDDLVKVVSQILLEEMRTRPHWAHELPLDAEVGVGQTYGDAK